MKIAASVLSRLTELPADPRALRDLLDDLGLEVKRMDVSGDDARMTLELLANRGDHHGYNGLAREIAGRTGRPWSVPPYAKLERGESPIPLLISTPLCLVYTATLLVRQGEDTTGLSSHDLAPIDAAGIHSVSAPVDATNLSNLEFGQPTHAFDADTIAGAIVIRTSRPGERCLPLFQTETVELPVGTLVIADEEKILAVAGVIGCEESKTTAATRRILLESATFDPVSVRKAGRALGLKTDACARFERGSDPSLPLVGAGRVVHLLESTGVWRREGCTGQVGDWTDPERTIQLDPAAASRFLATELGAAEITERLGRTGYTVAPADGGLSVRVPPHRLWDVEFDADLYEDLARSLGYNHTPGTLPPAGLGALPTPGETMRVAVEEVLLGAGFYEVISDGFHGRALLDRLELPEGHVLGQYVETQNALDRGYSVVKNNALSQAVEAIAGALRRKASDVKLYEWTRTFHPDPTAANEVCTERPILWAACCGEDRPGGWEGGRRAADAVFLKGLVAEIAAELGLPLELGPLDETAPLAVALHPGRRAAVRLDGRDIGLLGEIHPNVARNFGIKRERVCYLELEAAALERAGARQTFVEPSAFQPIDRSLAFTLPHRVEAGAVVAALTAAGPAWLDSVRIVDLFRHEEDGQPVRTVTFHLRFTQDEGSRTADEVNTTVQGMIAAVHAGLGERGVKLRA